RRPGKPCRKACMDDKTAHGAACRTATDPIPPSCGETCGTFVRSWTPQPDGPLYALAVDRNGNVFAGVANATVQKFTNSGTLLTTFGSFGTANGQFQSIDGMAVDGAGNVFVADSNIHRVQKFNNGGTFVTAWGTMGSGDGEFAAFGPFGVGVDSRG